VHLPIKSKNIMKVSIYLPDGSWLSASSDSVTIVKELRFTEYEDGKGTKSEYFFKIIKPDCEIHIAERHIGRVEYFKDK